jgi:predicted ferric reductase
VILLARLPALERLVGFDRLTVWHRWNGHATIDLVVAHVLFSVWGYALMDRFAVVATSYVVVRRRLRHVSVTVTGAELGTVDAYATAAFAMGAQRAVGWTARLSGYEALTILADGRVLSTPGFPAAD